VVDDLESLSNAETGLYAGTESVEAAEDVEGSEGLKR